MNNCSPICHIPFVANVCETGLKRLSVISCMLTSMEITRFPYIILVFDLFILQPRLYLRPRTVRHVISIKESKWKCF